MDRSPPPAEQLAQVELQLKQQELTLREREQANREQELQLKRKQDQASKWGSPIVVAVFAATVAGLANAGVAIINGYQTRTLEESKAESSRILEVIKTGGDTEKAAENLRFLIRSGLVSSHPTVDKLSNYLSQRRPGEGVTLPSASDRFSIENSSLVAKPVREDLSDRLSQFTSYLAKIGFGNQPKIEVVFINEADLNAYYSPSDAKIHIHPKFAPDPHVALVVFAEYALLKERSRNELQDAEYIYLDHGLSDYLAASFTNNPKIGPIVASVYKREQPFLRDLTAKIPYSEVGTIRREPHDVGEVWSAAFWAIRDKIGQDKFDPLLVISWKTFRKTARLPMGKAFLDHLVSTADRTLSPAQATAVRIILDTREFPLNTIPEELVTAS